MRRFKSILIVLIGLTAAFAAVADTNVVVATTEKCQQAASSNVVSASVKANVDVVQVVGGVPPDSNSRIENRKCHEFDANHGYLIAFGIFVSMVIFNVIMMFSKKITECRRRAVSMGMLTLLVGLITFCSFMWVERVMENCDQSRKIFRGELEVNRFSKSDAVLEAYDQLNSELSRWFTVFAVLGTFFGLVLPIGGYLLQIKEAERKKEEIYSDIKSLIADANDKFKKETSGLWRCHSSVAHWMVMKCQHRILRFMRRNVASSSLGVEGVGLLAWVMIMIKTALATEDADMVASKIEALKAIFDRLKGDAQYNVFLNATLASPAKSSVRIDLDRCREILKDKKSPCDYLEQLVTEFHLF